MRHCLTDLVTEHMRTSMARLHRGQTIEEALSRIRQQRPEGRIAYFYVVDDQNQ
jgi:Mg/Co/Ni transporter MgtE